MSLYVLQVPNPSTFPESPYFQKGKRLRGFVTSFFAYTRALATL